MMELQHQRLMALAGQLQLERILGGGGKAEVEMRQRVGRGLRAKKNQANVCLLPTSST